MKYIVLVVYSIGLLILGCGQDSTVVAITPAEPISTEPTRIACVGDSITEGTGISNPNENSYPVQLSKLIGEDAIVKNFGTKGATLLNNGNKPYNKTSNYQDSHDFNPEVVVIMLGTNDCKPGNWNNNASFKNDYKALITSYKTLSSNPTVYISLPPPVYATVFGITNNRIANELIPMIRDIASSENVNVIDIYTALSNKKELFPDKLHPNAQGAGIIAQTVYQTIY